MVYKFFLLSFFILTLSNNAIAAKTCSTSSVGQISEVIDDGKSKNSDLGTVSHGTMIIDSDDLKRKQCNSGEWKTLDYDGINANTIDPWVDLQSKVQPLNNPRRRALEAIGHIRCNSSTGTGFLLNLETYGAKAERNYDVILTSCHVIKDGTCKFHPRERLLNTEPQESIDNHSYQDIYTRIPYKMGQTTSDEPCSEIYNSRVTKIGARKDWVFVKLDKKVDHIPDHQRIILQKYNNGRIKNIANRGELYVLGAAPREITYKRKAYSIYEVIYSKNCKARVLSNNVVHSCISFPGMSGGPTGYFSSDEQFVAVGINSWSSEVNVPLHKKDAGQIKRGAATAIDDDQIIALRRFINQIERSR